MSLKPSITVLLGPPRTGKTARVLDRYRDLVASGVAPERLLVLAPTGVAVEGLLDRMTRGFAPQGSPSGVAPTAAAAAGGAPEVLLGARVMTFQGVAQEVLRRHHPQARRVSALRRRLLIGDIVAALHAEGAFSHYARIAETAGFLDTVGGLLAEFKRQEITPERFLEQLGGEAALADKDRETLAIYAEYQRRLRDRDEFDEDGELWRLRDLLHEGQRAPFEHLRAIFLDGFHSFTPTELGVLPLLAEGVPEVLCTLPGDPDSDRRGDLFHTVRRTIADLEKRCAVTVERVTRTAGSGDALLVHLAETLFDESPQAQPPGGEGSGFRVPGSGAEGGLSQARPPGGRESPVPALALLEAAGPAGEAAVIARRIKRLVVEDGRAPEEIAVIVRSLSTHLPAFEAAFGNCGIPLSTSGAPSAASIPAVRFALDCLETAAADWPWRQVAGVAKSSYAPALRDENGRALSGDDLELALRNARVAEGYANYSPALERLIAHLDAQIERGAWSEEAEGDTEEGEEAARPTDPRRLKSAAQAARTALPQLAKALGDWPREATWSQFITSTRAMVRRLGLVEAACREASPGPEMHLRRRDDLLGLAKLDEVLDELAAIHTEAADAVSLPTFVEQLRWALAAAPIDRPAPHDGAVRLLDAHEGRTLRFPVVFVAGLLEGAFPRAHREHPFYGEDERDRLRQHGLWLPQRIEDQHEEMFLFLMAVTRAEERLFLTYPYVDALGQKNLVSSYVEEVQRVLGETSPQARPPGGRESPSLTGAIPVERTGPAVVAPDWSDVASDTDLRLRVVHDLWARDLREPVDEPAAKAGLRLLDTRDRRVLRTLLRGAAVERERDSLRPPGRWDGVLADPRILERLTRAFSRDVPVSPSALDSHRQCPFAFFLGALLGAEEPPEPQEDLPPDERGLLLHQVLAAFYRERRMRPPTEADRDEATRQIEALAEPHFRQVERAGLAPVAGLWRVHREEILRSLRQFVAVEVEEGNAWHPIRVEWTFGTSGAPPVEITDGQRRMRIAGRLDRVDVPGDGSPGLRVIDYKTGFTMPDPKEGLQLPLYLLAAERYLLAAQEGAVCSAVYYGLRGSVGPIESARRNHQWWRERLREAEAAALDRLDAIRAGRFHPNPTTARCPNYCPWRHVCRQDGDRIARKVEERGEAP